MPPFHPPRRTPTVQPVAPSALDRNDVLVDQLDGLLVEVLDGTKPIAWRAGALIALSDRLEAARARGQAVFHVAGFVTAEPELLAADLIGWPRLAGARGTMRAAARRAAAN